MALRSTALAQAGPMGRTLRRRRCPLAICLGAVASALLLTAGRQASPSPSFVGPSASGSPARAGSSPVLRRAGFSDALASKKAAKGNKKVLTPEDLKALHGDSWEMVDKIFKGKKAESPEAIMRARFTALYYKDAGFLAATEQDELDSLKTRTQNWALTLGLKEKSFFDNLKYFGTETESLAKADSFEVVSARGAEVEFKIRCRDGKVLHEKSTFAENKKYGWVYSGKSEFGKWE